MNESDFFSQIWNFLKEYGWALESIIILGLTIIAVYIERMIFGRLHPKLINKNKLWENAILCSLHKPLHVFLWFLGISLSIQVLSNSFSKEAIVFKGLPHIQKIGFVFILVWFFVGLIEEIEKLLLIPKEGRRHLDKTTIRAIGQVLRVIVVFGSILLIMQSIFGIGASALLAFAGGGGITIGWAAKDMLANFFGGLMIFLDRPFAIGDRVTSNDKEIEGDVEHIGWRLTRIKTLDKIPLYVPNSIFLNITVKNPSRMSHRRIRTFVGIRYEDCEKIPVILQMIREMLQSHPKIDQKQMILVNFANFGTSSLDILVHCFTRTIVYAEFIPIQEDILLKIMDIIKKERAQLAYPTSTIHLENMQQLFSK